jgi:hypothetical protein
MRYALIGLLAVFVFPALALAGDRHRGSGFSVSVGVGYRDSYGSRYDGGYLDTSFHYSNHRSRYYDNYDRGGRHDGHFRRDFYRPAPIYVAPPRYCPPPVVIYRPAPVYCPPPAYVYRPTVRYYGPIRSSRWGCR